MTPRPHPRASWPSNDDTTGFNLIVILLGCGLGAYLLWTNYHQAISAAAMSLAHQEILLLGHFTNRFQVADRQMAAADPAGVTLRDLYGIGRAIGLFVRIPATAFILLLAAICTVRAAPSRFKRAFDLDGLMREQATSFRDGRRPCRTAFASCGARLGRTAPGGFCAHARGMAGTLRATTGRQFRSGGGT